MSIELRPLFYFLFLFSLPFLSWRTNFGASTEQKSRMRWLQKPSEPGREAVKAGESLKSFLQKGNVNGWS
jgi:hypothetical protein